MSHVRGLTVAWLAMGLVMALSGGQAQAQHLDRHETRRDVRRIEERMDTLLDQIDDWTEQRWDERFHRIEDVTHATDHLEAALGELKSQLHDHDEPWDVRDQVRDVIGAAADVGHAVARFDFLPREVRESWGDLRGEVNNLARHYRLPPLEGRE